MYVKVIITPPQSLVSGSSNVNFENVYSYLLVLLVTYQSDLNILCQRVPFLYPLFLHHFSTYNLPPWSWKKKEVKLRWTISDAGYFRTALHTNVEDLGIYPVYYSDYRWVPCGQMSFIMGFGHYHYQQFILVEKSQSFSDNGNVV
mgnify:CR=1 FL=1